MEQYHSIKLIVGLGNHGIQYDDTRHNAGVWYVQQLARAYGASFQLKKIFFGWTTQIFIDKYPIALLHPITFMNRSGQAVSAISTFFKIPPQSILIAHDELGLPVGVGRLKQGGGHGGHNGLRDIIDSLGGNKDFLRLRLGIGHPGDSKKVINYVLSKPFHIDRQKINAVINEAVRISPKACNGARIKAMQALHTFKA